MQKPSTGGCRQLKRGVSFGASEAMPTSPRRCSNRVVRLILPTQSPLNLGRCGHRPHSEPLKLKTLPLGEGFLQKGPHLADVIGLGVDELLGEGVYPVVFAFVVMLAPQAFDKAPGIALNHHFGNL